MSSEYIMTKFYDVGQSYLWSNDHDVCLLLLSYKPRNKSLKINKAYREYLRKSYNGSPKENKKEDGSHSTGDSSKKYIG
jgi:hypothetical protein